MNESFSTDEATGAVLGGSYAVRIGLAMLVGLALMLVLVGSDKQRRETLEGMAEVTAVGDRAFLKLPAQGVVVSMEGRAFELGSDQRQELRDSRMRRLGADSAAGLMIYRYLGALAKDGSVTVPVQGSNFYLKTGVNEYVPVREKGK